MSFRTIVTGFGLLGAMAGCSPSTGESNVGGGAALGGDGGPGNRCGDGICSVYENEMSCPTDCNPTCGNGICEAGEGDTTFCPSCTRADPPCAAPCWTGRCRSDCACGSTPDPTVPSTLCALGQSCCNSTTCYDPTILRCISQVGNDCSGDCDCADGLACCVGSDGQGTCAASCAPPACHDDGDCLSIPERPMACCEATGQCFDTRCLSCCMPRGCMTTAECAAGQVCCDGNCTADSIGCGPRACMSSRDCSGGESCCNGACQPPIECPAPPYGCTYVGSSACSCGRLVCGPDDAS